MIYRSFVKCGMRLRSENKNCLKIKRESYTTMYKKKMTELFLHLLFEVFYGKYMLGACTQEKKQHEFACTGIVFAVYLITGILKYRSFRSVSCLFKLIRFVITHLFFLVIDSVSKISTAILCFLTDILPLKKLAVFAKIITFFWCPKIQEEELIDISNSP